MGRNKEVVCKKCCRVMRNDHLNRHMKLHKKLRENSLDSIYSSSPSLHEDDESEFSSSATDWEAPVQKEAPLEREGIIKTIKLDAAEYKNKLKLGKIVYEEIEEHEIPEESLRREYKEAKELYIKHKKNIDLDNVVLRPWQEALLNHIKPTNREVIWVIGRKGNEGKSWFQEYMESKYGWGKVICGMDIKIKKGSICHVLSKRSLMTTDTFLFDVGKANTDHGVNYELLEKIKNGRIVAAKFDSKELKFKTPNTVVVFSNEKPDVSELSKDRWKIFQIRDNDLIDLTDIYVKK
jgi:hypothetical protein